MTNASVVALLIVGALCVLLGVRLVPAEGGVAIPIGSLLLIVLGQVAFIAAGVLQLAGARRA